MGLRLIEFRRLAGTLALAGHPRIRKTVLWVVGILLAIEILGALVAPPLVRRKLSSELSNTLHRQVSIQQIRISPYTLSVWIRGFLMKQRQGSGAAASFDELYVNLQLLSLIQRGIVLKEIRLVKPYISLIRNKDLTYNFTDLIEQFTKGPSGPTPRFSLNNIRIIDGKIDFDDRPKGVKHTVTSIRIGVPFISSLPSYTDINVEPAFSAIVNGSPLEIGGESKPFKESRESTLRLDINQFEIPKYLEYSPVELKFKVPSGRLEGKISASFRTAKGKASVLSISGNIGVKDLAVQDEDSAPILKLPSFDTVVGDFEVFANRARLKAIKIQGPELYVTRNRDGNLNLASLIPVSATESGSEQKKSDQEKTEEKKTGVPFGYRIDEVLLDQGKLVFTDQALERPVEKKLENIHVLVKGLTNEPQKKAETEISFQSDANEQFSHSGTLQLTPLSAEGKVQLQGLQIKAAQPYIKDLTAGEIRDGLLDLDSRFTFEQKDKNVEARLFDFNAAVRSFRLDLPGMSQPLSRISFMALKDTTIDVAKKSVTIGAIESRDATSFIQRDSDGSMSYSRLAKAQPSKNASKPPDNKNASKTADRENPWTVSAKRLAIDRFKILFEDRSLKTPTKIVVSDLSARGENFSTAKNVPAKVAVRAKINEKGSLRLAGTAGISPAKANLNLEVKGVEILPFEPYLADQINFLLTGGEIGTKGKFTLEPGAQDGSSKLGFQGDLQVTDFSSVESAGKSDLLKWKSLVLGGIQFSMQPVQLRLGDIALTDFYSRVVIAPDGKINVQNLVAKKKEEAPKESAPSEKPAQPATAPASTEPQITIGKISLKGGNVNFSDFFVKPNYSANLTQVQGSVSELKPDAAGDVQLQAKIDNDAPVEINGKINPLGKDLYLDIKAKATDIELSPLTPYSAKYVGYGIERGKLSLDVKYRVENRKITAENNIILNQLTFGDKIESPTATKLPVLLAVALLKDRNGVIDVNLPIGGSLDDPQFSVGGIVLQLFMNIIVKAVTSPFTLLASAFGGGAGQELSYVEFDYGRAKLKPAAEGSLKTLAKALNDRPALKLEISGRTDPVNDLEGLKQAILERKVKAQKMKELAKKGAVPKSVDDVEIESGEYERFLKAAYGEESFPKPRNIIGFAKDLPVPEMEKLMLEHIQPTDADLRQLATERAQAVKDFILATGQASADRLFMVASKPVSEKETEKAKAKLSRVDFSLR